MNDRSRSSLRGYYLGLGLLLGGAALPLALASCGPPDGAAVTDAARAGCEAETQQNVQTNQNMLPGRNCGYCHHAGGQASNSPWTVSGTVFADKASPCNAGGVAGLVVQVLDLTTLDANGKPVVDANGNALPQDNGTMVTNSVGNFWSAAVYTTPLRMRVFQPDPMYPLDYTHAKKTIEMQTPQGGMTGARVNCADCHASPPSMGAAGRIYFN